MVPIRPEVESFVPYEPGLSIEEIAARFNLPRVIKLASNENPLGVSPMVQEVLHGKVPHAFRYPQGGNPRLRKAVADFHHVDESQIFVGAGLDEVIDLLFRVVAEPGVDNAVASCPCFGLYETQAKLAGVELRQAPLKENFAPDTEALLALTDKNTRLFFLTTPDNPSGYWTDPETLAQLARRLPKTCLFVLDEAYIDFVETQNPSLLPRLQEFPHVAFLRTMSKVYGLAGMRIGYAILPPHLADYLWRVRLPFSVSILAEEAALAGLADREFYAKTVQTVQEGRFFLTEALRSLGCKVIPSQSNFLLFMPPAFVSAKNLHNILLEKGFILRTLGSYHLPDYLRLSIGNGEENSLLIEALTGIFHEENHG